jgi:gamma-glutamyltranspeptidase/glutathione hydrolase
MSNYLTTLLISLFFTGQIVAQNAIFSYSDIAQPVPGHNGIVATQEKHATQVGINILKEGGNAIDAAVAVGYALAVTLPRAGNLGGGGFMMVYEAKTGKVFALDYREEAPNAAHKDMFLDENGQADNNKSRYSLQASGVPGTVAGLNFAAKKWGTLPLKKLISPSIELAKVGIPVSADLAGALAYSEPQFTAFKDNPALNVFFKNGVPLKEGDTLVQHDLAKSLWRISRQGNDAFYQGEIAEKLTTFMNDNGGIITSKDLLNYSPKLRPPIKGNYRGYEVYSMPPPSSGGIHLIQILNTIENVSVSANGHNTAKSIHIAVEAMKYAYADRSKYLGDTDYVDVPINKLTSKDYAKKIANTISKKGVVESTDISPGTFLNHREGNETTHFTIIDSEGNIVSNTYTLNFSFGSKIMIPETGILLNNEMDDFSAKPGHANAYGLIGGTRNAIEPGKRMLSSMTPTIILKDGAPFLATGSPGGSRIITTVFQLISNVIDHGMNVQEASNAIRFHHQWYPDEIRVEKGFNKDTQKLLEKMGYKLSEKWAMGSTQSIMKIGDMYYGASDPRKPGALTVGY